MGGTRPRTIPSAVGVVTDLTGGVIFGGYRISRHAVSYPHVRFQTADGRTIEFRSKTGTNAPPQVGDEVTVCYDPERPEEASSAFASAFKFNPRVALVAAGAISGCGTAGEKPGLSGAQSIKVSYLGIKTQ